MDLDTWATLPNIKRERAKIKSQVALSLMVDGCD